MKNNSPYIVALNDMIRYYKNYNLNNKEYENNGTEFSPTSGAEPSFEPEKWNNRENIKYNHNCYAYLLDKRAKRIGKPQPGYFSGFTSIQDDDYNCFEFYKRLKKDIPSLYLSSFDEKCKKGFYKGFIALDTKLEDSDYHFYRQDKSGYWSHKPGRQDAVDYDANMKKIKNPVKANRKYRYFNYNTPCFFFCMNNKLAHARAR